MATEALSKATLAPAERRTVARFIALVEERLGERLISAWLYGSRARGEPPHDESDVDVMLVTASGHHDGDLVYELLWDAAELEGANPASFSVQVVDSDWIEDRRRIRSFFIQEVDRDKLVLAGGTVSPRSEEFMAAARARLANARDDFAQDHLAGAASAAYYAMLYAARAALSERDLHAKTHSGVWSLFITTFVATGDFGKDLARRARAAQRLRELGDYEAKPPTRDDAEELVATAGEFIEAVERMLA